MRLVGNPKRGDALSGDPRPQGSERIRDDKIRYGGENSPTTVIVVDRIPNSVAVLEVSGVRTPPPWVPRYRR